MMCRPLIRSFPASLGLQGGLTGPSPKGRSTGYRSPLRDRHGAGPNDGLGRTWTRTHDSRGGRPSMLTLGYKASAEQFGPRELLDFAIQAERTGFDSVFVSDHFQPWRHTDGHAPNCFAWLGALAAADGAGRDRDERADSDVPLPPGDRRPGDGDDRLPRGGTAGHPRRRHRRVAQRGAARDRVAGPEGAVRAAEGGERAHPAALDARSS